MYPVGACYFSTVNTSPATTVGGTWAAMTGGMLGLAGSTGVASAASNGGSLKIPANALPNHTHTFGWRWNSGNAVGGSDNWSISLENSTEGAITDISKLWYEGGAELYSCSHRCLWLEKNCLNLLEVSGKWRLLI